MDQVLGRNCCNNLSVPESLGCLHLADFAILDMWLLCMQVQERMSGRRQEQTAVQHPSPGQDVSGEQIKSAAAFDDAQIGWDDDEDEDDDMFGGPRF